MGEPGEVALQTRGVRREGGSPGGAGDEVLRRGGGRHRHAPRRPRPRLPLAPRLLLTPPGLYPALPFLHCQTNVWAWQNKGTVKEQLAKAAAEKAEIQAQMVTTGLPCFFPSQTGALGCRRS